MKKNGWNVVMALVGVVLLATGLILLKTVAEPQGILLLVFTYLFVVFYGIWYRCKLEKEL